MNTGFKSLIRKIKHKVTTFDVFMLDSYTCFMEVIYG